jgi:hypothetical protein
MKYLEEANSETESRIEVTKGGEKERLESYYFIDVELFGMI